MLQACYTVTPPRKTFFFVNIFFGALLTRNLQHTTFKFLVAEIGTLLVLPSDLINFTVHRKQHANAYRWRCVHIIVTTVVPQ